MRGFSIILALIIVLSIIPAASAEEAQPTKRYFWEPFTTWFKDAVTLVVTGVYPPEKEAEEGRPRAKTNNPWFW